MDPAPGAQPASDERRGEAVPAADAARHASLHRKLVWLTFFRVVMVTVLLGGTAAMTWSEPTADGGAARPLYALVAATFAASLALAVALHRRWSPPWVAHAQVALDVLIAAAVVRLTGGHESVFVFLFSLAIVNGSILLFRRGAVVAAALATATYLATVAAALPPGSTPRWDTLFAHVAAFALIAALAGYLAEQLRDAGEKLAAREIDLEAVQAIHEALVQSVSSGLLTTDPGGRITFLNRAGEGLTGVRLADVVGDPVERWFGAFEEMVRCEEMPARKEKDFVARSGGPLRLGYLAFPLRGKSGARIGHAVIFQDLTPMRAMQDAVRRSERLADLGSLAAGLAHELRNPLASITGSVELLKGNERLREGDRRLMDIVLREAGRLDDLVRRFLQFTRPAEPRCAPTDLALVVAETLDVFAGDREGVRVERDLAPVVVPCDGDQVKQVLWNLLTNAAQAIGAVEERPPAADPLARARGLIRVSCGPDPQGGARLAVEDDGAGIAPPDLLRLFTPFFTTKRAGTGLGLATVHRIVEAHGGSVSVDSREGEGATFVVRLPDDVRSPRGLGSR
jgi:two-component system sensor histidine kinase PilS (NtrC family)